VTGTPEDPLTRTGVLRAHFGEHYRFWMWLREQFTPVSLSVIASVIIAASGYIMHLRESISAVTMRVVVLETRVIPVIDQSNLTAALEVQINDMGDRVERLEQHWDNASDIASIPSARFAHQRRPR
jgi:hypothetical protein